VAGFLLLHALEQLAGLLERPGLALKAGGAQRWIDGCFGHQFGQSELMGDLGCKHVPDCGQNLKSRITFQMNETPGQNTSTDTGSFETLPHGHGAGRRQRAHRQRHD
jgi:hypothetical protein